MSFKGLIQQCNDSLGRTENTDCSRESFVNEYLKDLNTNNTNKALAEAKPGETLNVKLVDHLDTYQDQYLSTFQQQIAWSQPYKQTAYNLPDTLDKMTLPEARQFVDTKLTEAATLKAPKAEYPKSEYLPSSDPLMNLGFDTPYSVENQNEKLPDWYPRALRQKAVEYFDKKHSYDDVRELAMGLPKSTNGDEYSLYFQNAWLRRPEIAISSAQQKRVAQIFDKLDRNENGELSESELKKALKSTEFSGPDKEIVQLLIAHRAQIARANDDSVFFSEKNISREDLKHMGRVVKDQPKAFFDSWDDNRSDSGYMNAFTLTLLR